MVEEELQLELKVESFRIQMIELAAEKGSLIDGKVIEISQQLDTLLVRLQRMKTQCLC